MKRGKGWDSLTADIIAIGHLQKMHLKDLTEGMTISLEDMDELEWKWSREQTEEFIQMWNLQMPLKEIAVELERSELDCLFKAIDLIYRESVKPREWKIW